MALQDVLGSLQNPAASRNAILQRLGIDPLRAGGFGGNTQFDQGMSDLYRTGLNQSAQYDTEEGDTGRNYQQNLAQATVDRDRALEVLKGNMAQRGMTFSGANTDEVARTMGDYERYIGNLGADYQSAGNRIGTGRLNLESSLNSGRGALETGYGSDLGAFLQQQAMAMLAAVTQQQQMGGIGGGAAPSYSAPRAAAPAAPVYRAPTPQPQPQYSVPSSTMKGTVTAPVKKPLTPLRGPF